MQLNPVARRRGGSVAALLASACTHVPEDMEPAPPADVIERPMRKAAEPGFDTQAPVYMQHSG